ncbi:MAG: hypothetical protein ACT4OI_11095 [Methanobacteriota archaeon]
MAVPLPPGAPMPPPMAAYYPAPMPVRRPIGVTILGVLTIVVGVLVVFGGIIALLAALALLALPGGLGISSLLAVLAVLVLLFGLLWILAGFGLLRLKRWAWWLAVIVSVLNILFALPAWHANVLTLAASVIIFVYLLSVYRYFGQARPMGM